MEPPERVRVVGGDDDLGREGVVRVMGHGGFDGVVTGLRAALQGRVLSGLLADRCVVDPVADGAL